MTTRIHAHRGLMEHYPESTIRAFEAAIRAGADALEFDVRETADGRLVVHHDAYLGTTDDGTGILSHQTLGELRRLDAGSWFGEQFKGEKIPTLDEVLELARGRVQLEVQIEGLSRSCVQAVLDRLSDHAMADAAEYTSSFPQILCCVRELAPAARIGVFLGEPAAWMKPDLWLDRSLAALSFVDAQVAHVPAELLEPQALNVIRGSGYRLHAADCNTTAQLDRVYALNIDQLSTDAVELALRRRRIAEG